MTALPYHKMTVDEYLAWAERQPGRYELVDGNVYAMTPERAAHAEVKLAVHMALVAGIRARGLPCHVLPDGMTVRINAETAYDRMRRSTAGPGLLPPRWRSPTRSSLSKSYPLRLSTLTLH